MADVDVDIVALVRRMPGWEHVEAGITPITAGITNRNFRVDIGGSSYVLRLPGERTELLGIDRAGEAEAARRAATLGIGPPVVGELPGVGTLVTAFVGGYPATTAALTAPGVLERVAAAVRRFHDGPPLRAAFPIFRVVEWHARDAADNGVEPPAAYDDLVPIAAVIEAAFDRGELLATPCHNDLLPANVLLDGGDLWLIDYEYAGMNHALFDLANLSVNAGLDEDDDIRLLAAYGAAASPRALARLGLMKVMSELREGMWAVVQQAISTLGHVDFTAYGRERLDHCAQLVGSPAFSRWLASA